ncbi:hypothetical protein BGZ72_008590 [Mortierella alpina]|nr:hypothetical protein BGZ72_008590 [Mortierella alpina]
MLGKTLVIGAIASFLSFASTVAAEVHALTPKDFDQAGHPFSARMTIGSTPALVEFYAPWCGHCKIYAELGQAFTGKQDKVLIAKVDADAHRELGSRFGIKGFPTLKWFPKGVEGEPEDYSGGRDLESLAGFVTKKSGVKSSIVKTVSAVTVLTDASFENDVLKSGKHALVEFFAPWCGHCKNLAPVYEKVAQDFLNDKHVLIGSVDATVEKAIAEKHGVSGYPTIKFFKPDGTVEDYEGGRSEQDFIDFINKKVGTQRVAGGLLSSAAGRIPELDELVSKFVKATKDEKKAIKDHATELAATLTSSPSAKYYARFFEKVLATPNYAITEAARLAKIIANKSVNHARLDDFSIRHNIISVFTQDEDESAASTGKDEL